MDYNTQREHLKLPEYGRNVHKMIQHTVGIEDREVRQSAAETIIEVMRRVNPSDQKQSYEDVQHKLWDHLFIISDYQLDVDSPYPKPSPETFSEKPERVPYPKKSFRYDQYGKTIELLIEKARSLPEGEAKEGLTLSIANLMKRAYLQWNRDSVQDELIVEHLSKLSEGELKIDDPSKLTSANELVSQGGGGGKKKKKRSNNRNKKRKN
ncbi:MAG: DUF4290 domain-containing protein [Flavobacteriales bacterium]